MAGYVDYLDYEMYDVAIHIKNEVPQIETLDFSIVFVAKNFTVMQIIVRSVYTCFSALMFMAYTSKICCRVPSESKKYITLEQF